MKFLNTIYGSWIKVFVTGTLTLFLYELSNGKNLFSFDLNSLEALITAGITALAPVILNYLNPNDPRYGK